MKHHENRWLPAQSWWGVNDLQRELSSWFDLLTDGVTGTLRAVRPSMSIAQDEEAIKVKVALPGFKPDEVETEIQGDILTIRAKREEPELKSDERYLHRERSMNRVEEMLKLPGRVAADAAKAAFVNGVLEITVPRAADAKPRTVKVKAIDK